jgi:hypothetical protein
MSGRAEDVERDYHFGHMDELDIPTILRRPKWKPVALRWGELPYFVRVRARDKGIARVFVMDPITEL